ncbi:MAG: hypothetical protein WKF83_06880 [Nocardioidaceae bacterium]
MTDDVNAVDVGRVVLVAHSFSGVLVPALTQSPAVAAPLCWWKPLSPRRCAASWPITLPPQRLLLRAMQKKVRLAGLLPLRG